MQNPTEATITTEEGELIIIRGAPGEKGVQGEKGEPGIDGENGEDGVDGEPGQDGVDGIDGIDGDNGKDGSPDTAEQISTKLNTLEKVIDLKVLKDFPDFNLLSDEIAKGFKKGGKYQLKLNDVAGAPLDMRWHGGGLSKVIHDDTLTGDGTTAKPLSVLATGSFTLLTTNSVIDDSNQTFVFTASPSLVVINGQTWRQGSTSGGVIMWTKVGTTVTTAFPVGQGGDIYGII